ERGRRGPGGAVGAGEGPGGERGAGDEGDGQVSRGGLADVEVGHGASWSRRAGPSPVTSTFVRDGPPPVAAPDPTEVSSDTTAAMPDTDRYVTQSAVSSDAASATMREASVWANVLTARSNAAFQKDPVNIGCSYGTRAYRMVFACVSDTTSGPPSRITRSGLITEAASRVAGGTTSPVRTSRSGVSVNLVPAAIASTIVSPLAISRSVSPSTGS